MGNRVADVLPHDTVTRVLQAAEDLFAELGVAGASVRQITARAGVNIASVNYHFGSKDQLAERVFERVITRVTAERMVRLERIRAQARAKDQPPDLALIVSAFLEPYLGDGNEAQGALMGRFILMHRLTPNPATTRIVQEHLNPLAAAYVEAFGAACPKLSTTDRVWRYLMMVSAIVLTSAEDRSTDRVSLLTEGSATIEDRAAMRDAMVRFLVGALGMDDDVAFVPGAGL